ncbi:MAG: hypothetical protein P4L99_28035 [Chthoniobacter sp.]|nr:hypothetical protein [Chthoniobacter sp.]
MMTDRLVAVFSSLNDSGVAIAQLTLRKDGTLDHFVDPSVTIDTLALLLRAGPAKLEAMIAAATPRAGE